MSEEQPAPKRKKGWIVWLVVIAIALVPIPYHGMWFPAIFVLFDQVNNFLPENF